MRSKGCTGGLGKAGYNTDGYRLQLREPATESPASILWMEVILYHPPTGPTYPDPKKCNYTNYSIVKVLWELLTVKSDGARFPPSTISQQSILSQGRPRVQTPGSKVC